MKDRNSLLYGYTLYIISFLKKLWTWSQKTLSLTTV